MRPLRDEEIHVRPLAGGGVEAVLAEYLGRALEPGEVRRTPLGKPYVAAAAFDFSVSHTFGCALVAISTRAVGIDAEAIAPLPDLESLVSASLAASEAQAMAAMQASRREAWYYRCWVRKEAVLKARGCGLTLDPRAIDTTRPQGPWQWHDARLAGGVVVSIATAHPRARIVWIDTARGAV